MTLFSDIIENETLASVRARIVGYAQAAEVTVTNWREGGVAQQMLEAFTQATHLGSLVVTQIVRGFASLDTSTDPGDYDYYDPANEGLDPEPGFLSAYGENTYGTPRGEATFASGFVTFTNAGTVQRTFAPGALTFTWTANSPPSPPPTYRNGTDAAIYTNADGSVTVAAGATLVIPVTAEEIGTRSNASATSLSMTTVFGGCSATNTAPVVGTDREIAANYRIRCRKAPARLSLGGPSAAYEYLAKTQIDGEPLLNASEAPVNITRVQSSQESSTGIVDVFYASGSGAATAEDVTAANANIEIEAFATPGAITFTGAAAAELSIPVLGQAKVKAGPGVTIDGVKVAILAALTKWFSVHPIGGVDQVLDAGVIYSHDVQSVAACAYPGMYDVLVTSMAGTSTPLAKGVVAVLSSAVEDWTVVIV